MDKDRRPAIRRRVEAGYIRHKEPVGARKHPGLQVDLRVDITSNDTVPGGFLMAAVILREDGKQGHQNPSRETFERPDDVSTYLDEVVKRLTREWRNGES